MTPKGGGAGEISMTEIVGDGKRRSLAREEFFAEFLKVLSIPFVKPCAEGFFENIRQTESLLQMPHILFGFLEVQNLVSADFQHSVIQYWHSGKDCLSFLDEYRPAPPKISGNPEFAKSLRKRIDETLSNPEFGPPLAVAMQVLYSAAISLSWTAVECVASDLWVASLNNGAVPLAQNALMPLDQQEPGELTSKHIPVGLAARYGFDLRHCLGTLLKPRFDFTSVSGIHKAYKIFPMKDDFLKRILEEPLLAELEATRHLIVHRASKIDDEYKRRTGSSLEIGTRLSFAEDKVWKFLRVCGNTGFDLLAFVNDWFNAHKS
jgi:hypothetical protein